ncbi:sugar transferase [Streptomyces ipomoeae]|uniref:Exopolysaccharide biosynthesis polyprenyl glycosylphosphotransferase n=1 Tax=Streptomyces ipomoeae 91-03 TaxID=698759 RepID=L1L542_9ACTN|nr:sugar transferase [Streptomyces ipomoeae]EKX68047.1 exopolysaccharide biosynthesis polyprenyl glycosylphosphotransferase [Streptomyces ipomoeae 91-03]MDX2694886.1 sugar transferase [Streptomyces ipomoeae]MDX2820827.1 sugar transferase [Streptomyces ipomoeae]MDX2839329.1 sugar transferase [Streptomyces ipomoeae]MDX2873266.1 sugar transferase [Streptomyces ipomoeae]
MTVERTVFPPAAQQPEQGFLPVSVLPPRGASAGSGFPARQRAAAWHAPGLPLLVMDAMAALTAVPALPHPLLTVPLLLAVLWLNARAALYRPAAVPTVLDELPAVCARITVSWCALAALVAALSPAHALSARTLLTGCALQVAADCAGRGVVHWRRRRMLLRNPAAALVVGPAATAQRVAAAFLRRPGCGLRPVGVLAGDTADGAGLPVLSTEEEVQRAVVQNSVRAVLLVGPAGERDSLVRKLAEAGCALWEVDAEVPSYDRVGSPAYEEGGRTVYDSESAPHGTGRVARPRAPRERIAGFSCRRLDTGRRTVGPAKRALDMLVSGVLLLLAGPLLLACAVVLRVSEGPGVVFRQERVGKDGLPFTLLKFRSHRPADAREAATRWSVVGERDMSRFCRFLRRSSLDELPQLWNVFRGDMSLVGPRPERPYFVARFSQAHPGYAARHRVRTGITGLAQINGLRGDTSIEDRARFDNAYIDDWSLWQDVCILLRTAAALVRPTGS